MPELPDITVYLDALRARVLERTLQNVALPSPFVLRSVQPPPAALEGRRVVELRRIGKRIVLGFDGALYLVIHLMIAGRLRWLEGAARAPARIALAMLRFEHGTLVLTEAGSKRRASLHVVAGADALHALDPGGADVLAIDLAGFSERLTRANHTLKRALTDPQLFSGIGNAYSDEILHAAQLSPVVLTQRLDAAAVERLFDAVRSTLQAWTERLRREAGSGFPEKVTAFRPDMAVHGRYGKPCPRCGAPVQRIVYAENETNYCARCQTGGRLLADRALSRLLHANWPRSIDELG